MSKPKMLHIALGDHNTGLWRSMEKVFETTHYNWIPHVENVAKINEDVLRLHNQIKPDIVFMQIQREGIIAPSTARKMTETSVTANWTGDVRFPLPNWFVELGKHVSVSLFSNMFDVKLMRQKGLNADFLQVGFDPVEFHPFGETIPVPKVIFMGSNYNESMHKFPLSPLRVQLVTRMKQEFGDQFRVFGNGWENIAPDAMYLNTHDESKAYRSCDIAINLSHFDYGRYSSDRIFRMMGSGAFCLSHNYIHIEKDFTINKHLATWSTIDELVEKTRYYLQNVYEREQLRMKGCEYVRKTGTWDVRFNELKNMLL